MTCSNEERKEHTGITIVRTNLDSPPYVGEDVSWTYLYPPRATSNTMLKSSRSVSLYKFIMGLHIPLSWKGRSKTSLDHDKKKKMAAKKLRECTRKIEHDNSQVIFIMWQPSWSVNEYRTLLNQPFSSQGTIITGNGCESVCIDGTSKGLRQSYYSNQRTDHPTSSI